jgi:hypothetical protein
LPWNLLLGKQRHILHRSINLWCVARLRDSNRHSKWGRRAIVVDNTDCIYTCIGEDPIDHTSALSV